MIDEYSDGIKQYHSLAERICWLSSILGAYVGICVVAAINQAP